LNIGYVLRYHREWYRKRLPRVGSMERLEKTEKLDSGGGCPCRVCKIITKRYKHQTLDRSTPDGTTIEHRLPEALGGPHEDWNLEISCWLCNTALGHVLGGIIGKYRGDVYNVPRKELEEFIRFHWNPKSSENPILWKRFEEEIARLKDGCDSDSQSPSIETTKEEIRGLANPLFSENSVRHREVKV